MAGCEAHGVGSGLAFARHEQLRWVIAPPMEEAAQRQQTHGKPAEIFTGFDDQTMTGSWSRARRVVAQAEMLEGNENPRSGVTNLSAERWPARALYQEPYCARGEMENRIKEPLSLFAVRVSAESMPANPVRLHLAGCADVWLHALRRLWLKGTGMKPGRPTRPGCAHVWLHALWQAELADLRQVARIGQCFWDAARAAAAGAEGDRDGNTPAATIRLRLRKIGARIRITARRIWLSMASGFPLEAVFRQVWVQLRC